MQVVSCAMTDIGIRRPINQDSVLSLLGELGSDSVSLLAVCDGMGGLKYGEVASSILVSELEEWFMGELAAVLSDDDLPAPLVNMIYYSMKACCMRADEKIRSFSKENNIQCGTTAVILLLYMGEYYLLNIGDSRCYLLRNGSLFQMTKDQTVIQQLLDLGEIDEETAKYHKAKGVLLQCVGSGKAFVPEYKSGTVLDKDLFFLCSDGFTHKISAGEFETILTEENPKTKAELRDISSYLIEECKKRHENDNISVVMARCSL